MKAFLSSGDAAKQLGVSIPTIIRLANSGHLKGIKIKKRWKFSDLSIDNFRRDLAGLNSTTNN